MVTVRGGTKNRWIRRGKMVERTGWKRKTGGRGNKRGPGKKIERARNNQKGHNTKSSWGVSKKKGWRRVKGPTKAAALLGCWGETRETWGEPTGQKQVDSANCKWDPENNAKKRAGRGGNQRKGPGRKG